MYNLTKILVKDYRGKVPKTFEELENLPGIGHKTARVLQSLGFGHSAFSIDTHIHRLWENKTIFNSFFWDINAFDQSGVELGKINTKKRLGHLKQNLNKYQRPLESINSLAIKN